MNADSAIKIKKDSPSLQFLYRTILGRVILRLLTMRFISKVAGVFLDSPLSVFLIPGFAKDNNIDMNDYIEEPYQCFNDFFIRKIKPELRPLDNDEKHFMAPCDGMLSAYHISNGMILPIKQSEYTLEELVVNKRVANEFKDGICLVFRLCVDNYHRYCYFDNGRKSRNVFIPGELHTVRPIALNTLPVFTRNCREYTLIKSEKFGTVLQMEVGAMLVGKIHNHHGEGKCIRGQEKGYFKYGGSTIVLLIKKDKVYFDEELFDLTDAGYEVPVKMGQMLGISSQK